ncbi:hypothetical protein AMK09_25745 [Streptomyces sp. CB02488]|nr:hypothetical protein AMK09_25745 [Streptomyces sp. CB02488]
MIFPFREDMHGRNAWLLRFGSVSGPLLPFDQKWEEGFHLTDERVPRMDAFTSLRMPGLLATQSGNDHLPVGERSTERCIAAGQIHP